MFKKLLISATFIGSIVSGATASATTLFFDDFESGLSQWSSVHGGFGGVVVDDPLQSDHALTFNRLWGSGDIGTAAIANPTSSYILSFDYLGTCSTGNCGGFIWNSATKWNGTTAPYADTLPDTGVWEHVVLTFSGSTSLVLQLEDWNGSGGIFGDAYFDNIELTDAGGSSRNVPEPGSIALLALGLAGLGFSRRKAR